MPGKAERIFERIGKQLARRAAAFALEVNRELRSAPPLGTPVQDGNARANWIPSVGQPASHGFVERAQGNAAAAAGAAQIVAYKLGDGDLFITNRTPYIRRLNDGHSKQSPALFVEAAIERARNKVMGGAWDIGGKTAQDLAGDGADNIAAAYSPLVGDDE